MKKVSLLVSYLIIIWLTTACQSDKDAGTQYNHWVCRQGEHEGAEIVFARMGNVFRG